MCNFNTTAIEELVKENERLKFENERLRRQVCQSKTWTSIREGIIMPKLKAMGAPKNCASTLATMIAQILKEFLDINKIVEINELNYEKAKNISLDLLQVLSKYEWEQATRLREYYKLHSLNI